MLTSDQEIVHTWEIVANLAAILVITVNDIGDTSNAKYNLIYIHIDLLVLAGQTDRQTVY